MPRHPADFSAMRRGLQIAVETTSTPRPGKAWGSSPFRVRLRALRSAAPVALRRGMRQRAGPYAPAQDLSSINACPQRRRAPAFKLVVRKRGFGQTRWSGMVSVFLVQDCVDPKQDRAQVPVVLQTMDNVLEPMPQTIVVSSLS